MSVSGRGRGYTGRHHARPEPRPGDVETSIEDLEAARTLAELSPRHPVESVKTEVKVEPKKVEGSESESSEEKPTSEMESNLSVSLEGEVASMKELLVIDEQYAPLLVLLEQFSPTEDGIQFNRKLRQFESMITSMCPDEARLIQAFTTFRAAALLNSNTARKLAAVGASFTRQQKQQELRKALLNVVMQGTYSKMEVLEQANPQFLINATNLMGDYFADARLCNGNKVHILAAPLLKYLKALLVSDDIRAHRTLATQLMQNGRELLSVLSQGLDELSISIRIRLLSPPPVNIIWLLLSADLCINKFLPLPNTLQQFYASHLELSQDDPNVSYNEVSYGSWKKTRDQEEHVSSESSNSLSDIVTQNISELNINNEEDPIKPKLRPILGAGAGLLRQEQQGIGISVSQDTWTPKKTPNRFDLNSWRQQEEENKEEPAPEPVFNPTVLPPNLSNVPNFPNVPDYPPPNIAMFNNFPPQEYPNFLQQGDGAYIQGQFQERPPTNPPFPPQGDGTSQFIHTAERQAVLPERVNNELQKSSSRRPVENWRKDKGDTMEESNKNRNWSRHRSNEEVEKDQEDGSRDTKFRSSRSSSRDIKASRRNSAETEAPKPRRHVTDVPRSHKYWDHDDRCDIDYTS